MADYCAAAYKRPDTGETLRDTSPFADVWKEAVAGEAIVERFLHGDNSFDYSPIALMRALLVYTWRPCGANGRDPAAGWALGTIFPEFDNLARPIKRRINHSAVAALPISFRPALLAGVSRAIANPAILNAIRDETILRGRRAFERLCETARLDAQIAGKAIKRESMKADILTFNGFFDSISNILKPRWLSGTCDDIAGNIGRH